MVSRVIQNQALKDKLKLFISPQLKHLLDLLSSDIVSYCHDPILSLQKSSTCHRDEFGC